MNLSGIPRSSLLGRLLRLPLRLLPKKLVVPVLQGKLRGARWIVGAGNHGYWLGMYEFNKRRLFEQSLQAGQVVYDLGGNVGYYTLIASRIVGASGRVVVFEPAPRNITLLKDHIRLNHAGNVTLVEAAVSDGEGTAYFDEGISSATGHIARQGRYQVRLVGLDELIENGDIPEPDVMKIDVEGAEQQVLAGAQNLLKRRHPAIFMDTHGEENDLACRRLLESMDYQLQPIGKKSLEAAHEFLAVWNAAAAT